MTVRYDHSPVKSLIGGQEWDALAPVVKQAHEALHQRSGLGAEYLGWLDWPMRMQSERQELERIRAVAERIRGVCDTVVVIGIGGSYAGIRATLDLLQHAFSGVHRSDGMRHRTRHVASGAPEVWYAGHHLSATYMEQLLEALEDRSFAVVVISKSGTTTEPAVAFRLLKQRLEARYGREGARQRMIVTTDAHSGALRAHAREAGYDSFVVPADIGGRYSVLTAVGLVPLAIAGIDVDSLLAGAVEGQQRYAQPQLANNESYQYAAVRNLLLRKGKSVELLVTYEPALWAFGEWWKQLFGESEGKDLKGIFPASVQFTTDLHSMGQYIQDGARFLMETVVSFAPSARNSDLVIPADDQLCDGLEGCVGKTLDELNEQAMQGTVIAHTDGGVPNTIVHVAERSAFALGHLYVFFQQACAMSGYILGVNPFDQPGVEAYKRNMLALLGKPGLESERASLLAQLQQWGLRP